MSNYYEPSGKFSIKSIFLFLLLCITVYPLLSIIYAYGIIYIPFIYILFILSGAYGYAIAITTSYVVFKIGKVRNNNLAYLLSTIGILVAFYFHWAIWVCLLYGHNPTVAIEFVMDPVNLIDVIKEVNKFGTWKLGSLQVNGIFLSIIWIIELLGVILISFISIGQVRNPFCEKTDKWFDKKELTPFNFIENQKDFTSKMEVKEQETLNSLSQELEFATESHSKFTLFFSKSNEYYLSVQNKEKKITSKGELEFNEIDVFENLRINKEVANKLKSI